MQVHCNASHRTICCHNRLRQVRLVVWMPIRPLVEFFFSRFVRIYDTRTRKQVAKVYLKQQLNSAVFSTELPIKKVSLCLCRSLHTLTQAVFTQKHIKKERTGGLSFPMDRVCANHAVYR